MPMRVPTSAADASLLDLALPSRTKMTKRSQFFIRGTMSSFRQIEANRRNAQLSTGPVTEEGKQRSRQNAVRHGLTAETVIDALEDADDYAAFEMTVTADFDAQSAVERELVLRLASLLWRLRRATAIEAGLFRIQACRLLQGRRQRRAHQSRQRVIDNTFRRAIACDEQKDKSEHIPDFEGSTATDDASDQSVDLTRSFLRLNNLQTSPLDRLNRYEATLWRQACQILWTLQCLDRRKPWAAAVTSSFLAGPFALKHSQSVAGRR